MLFRDASVKSRSGSREPTLGEWEGEGVSVGLVKDMGVWNDAAWGGKVFEREQASKAGIAHISPAQPRVFAPSLDWNRSHR